MGSADRPQPRLIAISGSFRGLTFPLRDDEILVGREAGSCVRLNHPSVSRRHCVIRRDVRERTDAAGAAQSIESYRFTIQDLDSYNGTFVNGLPVHEQKLAHGDQISLGNVQLLFLLGQEEGAAPDVAPVIEDELITRSTVRLRREDALYLRPDAAVADRPEADRVARNLATLLKISTSIGALSDSAELQTSLLEAIREVTPAERAAIMIADQQGLASVRGWNKLTGPDDSIRPSYRITNQVLQEGVALLSNDLFADQSLSGRPSLVEANICSILCVPLVVFEKVLGVIYLDTTNRSASFDEDHMELLTAIAGIAAVALEHARQVKLLENENLRLQREIRLEHNLVGESESLCAVLEFISKVAPTDSTVLIRGESGTGKELAARAIHLNSARSRKPFVAINCATLTETLIETELFGHEKGAFTGAIALKRGKLEVADGGTVFLDEVAELSPAIQGKLLRVLQEREFERLGGNRSIKVDVRIITATNHPLEQAMKHKTFRDDLYYRLNVVSVVMPPLRKRRDDIPLLANYFVSVFSKRCKRRVLGLSPEARLLLQAYDWPGNVRELENAIERAVVLGSEEFITVHDLPETLLEASPCAAGVKGFYQSIMDAKRQLIVKAMRQANGNYTQAARSLGVHPNNLHRLIRSLDIKSEIEHPASR